VINAKVTTPLLAVGETKAEEQGSPKGTDAPMDVKQLTAVFGMGM
jgi:hypothetical protein